MSIRYSRTAPRSSRATLGNITHHNKKYRVILTMGIPGSSVSSTVRVSYRELLHLSKRQVEPFIECAGLYLSTTDVMLVFEELGIFSSVEEWESRGRPLPT